MTTTRARAQWEFTARLAREAPGMCVGDMEELMLLARRLARIAERQCNGHQTPSGDWDEAAEKRDERAEGRIVARVRAILAPHGCEAVFSGDPRGAAVKVRVPSGATDDWGGVGICVPD